MNTLTQDIHLCPKCHGDAEGCLYCDETGIIMDPQPIRRIRRVKFGETILTYIPSGTLVSGRIVDGRQQ